MAQFDFYLNRQGVRGPQGIQGEQGFSPIITVATNTLSEYVLQIQTQNNTFLTANLREHKDDLGGTYIRYNRETGVMFAGDADVASQSQMGVVRFATVTDIERETEDCVVSPANVADMIDATGISRDITELQGQVSTNTNNITTLQGQMTGLLADYVPKSRTINGKALGSNITLTASDIGALPSTTPIPSKTSDLTNDSGFITSSDLPDMNNYYTKSQTNTLLDGKADISDIPTVGNGTITFTQGGVSKGTITVNQSGDTTIALDAAGSSLTAGTGIDITNDVISVDFTSVATASQGAKADTAVQPSDLATVATTGDYTDLINKPTIPTVPTNVSAFTNDAGYITSASLPDVSNMVTTDTAQTISGAKTFSSGINVVGINSKDSATQFNISGPTGQTYIKLKTDGSAEIGEGSRSLKLSGSSINIYRNYTTYTNVDSGNIGTYAITSNPVMTGATSSTAGTSGLVPAPAAGDDVKFLSGDGTYKTVSTDLTNYYTKSETDGLLDNKEDVFDAVSPINIVGPAGYGPTSQMTHTGNSYYNPTTSSPGNYPNINDDYGQINFGTSVNTATSLSDALDLANKGYIVCPYKLGDTIAVCQSGSSSYNSGANSKRISTGYLGIVDDTGKFKAVMILNPLTAQDYIFIVSEWTFSGNNMTLSNYELYSATSRTAHNTPTWGANECFYQILDDGSNIKINNFNSDYKNIYSISSSTASADYNLLKQINAVLFFTGHKDGGLVQYSGQPREFRTGENGTCGTSSIADISVYNNAGEFTQYFSDNANTLLQPLPNKLNLTIGTGLAVQNGSLVNTNPTAYSLPTASTSTLGGVKVDGTTVTIDGNGVISSAGDSLPSQTGHDGDVLTTDGTDASWADTEAVHVVVESYTNGTSWYRVHSDGWCEQGGRISISSMQYGSTSVSLLKTFNDTTYTITVGGINSTNNGNYCFAVGDSVTTNSFNIWTERTTGTNHTNQCCWQACGYIN